jgi:hypothetical protein
VKGEVELRERGDRQVRARIGGGGNPVKLETTSGDVMFRAL